MGALLVTFLSCVLVIGMPITDGKLLVGNGIKLEAEQFGVRSAKNITIIDAPINPRRTSVASNIGENLYVIFGGNRRGYGGLLIAAQRRDTYYRLQISAAGSIQIRPIEVSGERYSELGWPPIRVHLNVAGRRLTPVDNLNCDRVLIFTSWGGRWRSIVRLIAVEAVYVRRLNLDISPQLASFLVFRNVKQLTSKERSPDGGSYADDGDCHFKIPVIIALTIGFSTTVAGFVFVLRRRVVSHLVRPLGLLMVTIGFPMGLISGAALGQLDASNCFSENVGVQSVVIPELKLGNIERKILGGNLVESPDNAAFEDRPKAFDCLGMNRADNVLSGGVVNSLVRKLAVKMFVADPLIRAEQADFGGDAFAHKGFEGLGANIGDDAGHHISLAADRPRDNFLSRSASSTAAAALIPMPVFGFAADKRLVNLNNAHEFPKFLVSEASADAVGHVESGMVRTKTERPMDLVRRNAFLASQHQVDNPEPIAERLVGVLEDRAREVRETIAAVRGASVALPLVGHRRDAMRDLSPAARAPDAIRPTMADQIRTARIFVRKSIFPLGEGHLMNLGVLFGACHGGVLSASRGI